MFVQELTVVLRPPTQFHLRICSILCRKLQPHCSGRVSYAVLYNYLTNAEIRLTATHPLANAFELSLMISSMSYANTEAKYEKNDTSLKVPALHGTTMAQSQKTVAHLNVSSY